jgi:hypothetical protein
MKATSMTKPFVRKRITSFQRKASYGAYSGFQGYEPDGVITFQPKKKPRQGELTEAEKQGNRQIPSERIEIEHHIGGIKRSLIVVHPPSKSNRPFC